MGIIVHRFNQYCLEESKNVTTRGCKTIPGGQEKLIDELIFIHHFEYFGNKKIPFFQHSEIFMRYFEMKNISIFLLKFSLFLSIFWDI